MRTHVNRFKHLPHWSCEIENKGKFRGSSYWHNTAAQQVWHPLCAQATHNSGTIQTESDSLVCFFEAGIFGCLRNLLRVDTSDDLESFCTNRHGASSRDVSELGGRHSVARQRVRIR